MAKYINTAMAIEALEKGLDTWVWIADHEQWGACSLTLLTNNGNDRRHFAIGEKPTSPPRKMIEIDGVRMPAPIMRVEDLPVPFFITRAEGDIVDRHHPSDWVHEAAAGNAFATEADAIAARDARKLILERAMERAK